MATDKLQKYIHRGLQWHDGLTIATVTGLTGRYTLFVSEIQTMKSVKAESFTDLDKLELAMREVHDDLRHWHVLPEDTCD